MHYNINMERHLFKSLEKWRKSSHRKPLILQGARQVGKTWLLKSFGHNNYKNIAYFNFEESPSLASLFENSLNPQNILDGLSALNGNKIVPDDTLIIFDEIQEAPRAITSLKYFFESAPDYHLVSAGSLLGISSSSQYSFPVGCVDFLHLYPLSFDEFLLAAEENELLEYIKKMDFINPLPEAIAEKFIQYLKTYFVTGGMPRPVSIWFDIHDFIAVEQEQKNILLSYENDFARHVPPRDIPRIRKIWETIPSQLAKENKKFFFGYLKTGARAKEYEDALSWLNNAGLVYQVFRTEKPHIPVSAYDDIKAFKLYLLDTGLLRVKAGVPASAIANGSALFTEFKGAFTENYVLTELIANGYNMPRYWASNGIAEIDYLIQDNMNIFPLEVKATINTKARSLSVFREKFKPELMLRSTLLNLKKDGDILNIPLYLLYNLRLILEQNWED